MGCCKSSSDVGASSSNSTNSARVSLSFTKAEMTQLETLLSAIPDHCREIIIKLPARQLLTFYQYHMMALYHGQQREWSRAILSEQLAIKGLQALLPTNKDHYIFFNFYSSLSSSFLALGERQSAIEGIHIVLSILSKHTPMDYKTITDYYCRLAIIYKIGKNWKATAQCLTKAIETAQLSNDLDRNALRILENELQEINQQIDQNVQANLTISEVKQKSDENDQDFHRAAIADANVFSAKCGTLHFDKAKFERLPDKQTELQVNDEILQDILKHLENHIKLNWIGGSDAGLSSVQFIAAQFKNIQMKTSPLSPAVIEAALTMIIDSLDDENTTNDKLYTALKQATMLLSYTDDSCSYAKGVRVFVVNQKMNQLD